MSFRHTNYLTHAFKLKFSIICLNLSAIINLLQTGRIFLLRFVGVCGCDDVWVLLLSRVSLYSFLFEMLPFIIAPAWWEFSTFFFFPKKLHSEVVYFVPSGTRFLDGFLDSCLPVDLCFTGFKVLLDGYHNLFSLSFHDVLN